MAKLDAADVNAKSPVRARPGISRHPPLLLRPVQRPRRRIAGLDPGLIPFTTVLGLVWSHVAADTCCRHCGHRTASADAPLASLNAALLALPRHRPGRQRTSGRTATERRTRHTEEVTYTIDITKSNLPK